MKRGYLNPAKMGEAEAIDLLTPEGEHRSLAIKDVRSIYFVREFTDNFEPERKVFLSRPKLEGLWVRLKFRDNEVLEGMMPNDLTQVLPEGFLINPPDARSNTQRIFVPRTAIASLTVLSVIGGAQGRRRRTPEDERQVALFEE